MNFVRDHYNMSIIVSLKWWGIIKWVILGQTDKFKFWDTLLNNMHF